MKPEHFGDYPGWDSHTDKSPESLEALKHYIPVGETDPNVLMRLDKADLVSRYVLLDQITQENSRRASEFSQQRERNLINLSRDALVWFKYCGEVAHKGRKTVRLDAPGGPLDER